MVHFPDPTRLSLLFNLRRAWNEAGSVCPAARVPGIGPRARWSRLGRVAAFGVGISLAGLAPEGAAQAPHEYHLKAAFVFNFMSFVQWPEHAFESSDAPFGVGIIGDNPFGGVLAEMSAEHRVGARRCQLREIECIGEVADVHILFVSRSESCRVKQILDACEGLPVLTVSDIPGFARMGGMIELREERQFVRLTINRRKAMSADLAIHSKLLRLAHVIDEFPVP